MLTKKENRNKSVMQFVDMEMLVPQDHLVRKIDKTIDFEFIRDKEGNDYFLEMNFRNDGNAYCVTSAGVNLPLIWVESKGQANNYKKSNYILSQTFLLPEFYYFLRMLGGEVTFSKWYKNIKLATCCTTYFRNDKKPFVYFLLYQISLIIKDRINRTFKCF